MQHWDDSRRYTAALQEQERVNEEMAERARAESKKGGNFGFLLFVGAVILFKPAAEYCIELYNTVTGYLSGIAGVLGF
ncbi:hypothetical protein I6F15_27260 [Bradyrhizobium sp. BRP14]|nr:hypothetical protein [Bradyrhizobium sp. BRP14]